MMEQPLVQPLSLLQDGLENNQTRRCGAEYRLVIVRFIKPLLAIAEHPEEYIAITRYTISVEVITIEMIFDFFQSNLKYWFSSINCAIVCPDDYLCNISEFGTCIPCA